MPQSRLLRWLPFALILCIYVLELRVDLMDVDAAEYAHISQQMLATKSFLVVKNRNWDYLDKPPLSFWLAAGSFAVFGVSTAAYKFPSLLFALLAIYSTYRFARLRDGRDVGWTAALMLASTAAMFLWTNDVRTDTILTGAVAFAVWQLAELRERRHAWYLVGASVGIGLAMMTKGPIGLAVPALAVAGDAALRRDWEWLVSRRWLVTAAICLVMLAPMLWGLWAQFGRRGIEFYFWTQSFGRITGESVWHDNTTPLFFTHTLLWELLPWSLFFVVGFAAEVASLVRRHFRIDSSEDGLSLPGLVLPFIALSFSHYKLPHYIFPLVPLACVIAARQLGRLRSFRAVFTLQLIVVVALWFVTGWLGIRAFPMSSLAVWVGVGTCFVAAIVLAIRPSEPRWRLFGPSLATIGGAALMLAANFYPQLLSYQASSMAAHVLEQKGVDSGKVITYRAGAYSFDFLLQRSVPSVSAVREISGSLHGGDGWVFTDAQGRDEIERASFEIGDSIKLPDYPVTRLSLPFLRPAQRASKLNWRWLMHVQSG